MKVLHLTSWALEAVWGHVADAGCMEQRCCGLRTCVSTLQFCEPHEARTVEALVAVGEVVNKIFLVVITNTIHPSRIDLSHVPPLVDERIII